MMATASPFRAGGSSHLPWMQAVQGIIHSIAFNDSETVCLPAYAPTTPLIKVPESCNR